MSENTYKVKDAVCPVCSAKLDLATEYAEFNQDKTRPPQSGDLAVCQHCAEALEFQPDGTLQQASLKALMSLTDKERKAIGKTQKLVREKRPHDADE